MVGVMGKLDVLAPKVELWPPGTLALAEEAVAANAKRNAELAAMSPKEREKAIAEWARKLAEDTALLDD
jgi:hypothetical protein